jgi:c-di-GMP-related signal transduction protein
MYFRPFQSRRKAGFLYFQSYFRVEGGILPNRRNSAAYRGVRGALLLNFKQQTPHRSLRGICCAILRSRSA